MGKKLGWISAVKKALNGEDSKEKKEKRIKKSKGCFGEKQQRTRRLESRQTESAAGGGTVNLAPPSPPEQEDTLLPVVADAAREQAEQAYSIATASGAASEVAAVAAAQAAAEVVQLAAAAQSPVKSKEETAAVEIQTAFRGFMARRALRALTGLVRLRSFLAERNDKRQAVTTLKCMQTMSHVQSQIHARRIRISEENRALQRHLQHKHEKELEKSKTSKTGEGEGWDLSAKSKEQTEAKRQHKQEATIRREKALAYSYIHQQTWRKYAKPGTHTFMDPNNPHWGWSWLERWMAARPWEDQSTVDKDQQWDHKPAKSSTSQVTAVRNLNPDKKSSSAGKKKQASATRGLSVSIPRPNTTSSASAASKVKQPSPRGSTYSADDDTRSTQSVNSDNRRRHSIAGSSIRDDQSASSSPAGRMSHRATTTQAAKSRNRGPSTLGAVKGGTPERDLPGATKKRLSLSASPSTPRRHSGPSKIYTSKVSESSAT